MTSDAKLDSLLEPGERLIWSGRPNADDYAIAKSTASFPFGLLTLVIALIWITTSNQSGVQQLFGFLILTVGLGLVLSPLWSFFRGSRVTYLLTDRRAVIATSGFYPRCTSVALSEMNVVKIELSVKGFGDVIFRESFVPVPDGGNALVRDGFIATAEATRVALLLRSEIDKLSRGGAAQP
jgi:hypothetical protein